MNDGHPGSPIARLLIVDHESARLTTLCGALQGEGYEARGAIMASAALEALRAGAYDIMVTDLMPPGLDGIELLRAAWSIDPDLVGIVMTEHGTIDMALTALRGGALDYILKPFSLSGILPVLSRALAVRRLRHQNATLMRRVAERAAELETANQTLHSAQQQVADWVESISRELGTLLSGILGWCEVLIEEQAGPLNVQQRRYLVNIWRSGLRGAQFARTLTPPKPPAGG